MSRASKRCGDPLLATQHGPTGIPPLPCASAQQARIISRVLYAAYLCPSALPSCPIRVRIACLGGHPGSGCAARLSLCLHTHSTLPLDIDRTHVVRATQRAIRKGKRRETRTSTQSAIHLRKLIPRTHQPARLAKRQPPVPAPNPRSKPWHPRVEQRRQPRSSNRGSFLHRC